jgi:hypothetical protein
MTYPANVTTTGNKGFCKYEKSGVNPSYYGSVAYNACSINDPASCNQMMDYEDYEYNILN